MLPELSGRRAWLQARRKRSDADILAMFGDRWTAPVRLRAETCTALRNQVMIYPITGSATCASQRFRSDRSSSAPTAAGGSRRER
jgi:hypothetical protein